jgi:hypothetical protein
VTRVRPTVSIAVTGAVSLLASGCALLPANEARLNQHEVRDGVERALNVRLRPVPTVFTFASVDVRRSYTGRSPAGSVLVLDFESAAATNQIAPRGVTAAGGARVLRRRNVVVLYTPASGADRSRAVARALAGASAG